MLHEIDQYFPCCHDGTERTEPVNIRMLPEGQSDPLKVIDVCLPFVAVQKADRTITTLDVRRHELVRLDDAYARRVVKCLRAPRPPLDRRDSAG